MTKTALIIGSDGSEDIELIVTSDVLRRAGLFLIFFIILVLGSISVCG